ncbi:hypothetical protein [Nocardioides solisilvae]|uniref:hypothetical protein n=1 Tax=Nocardioides solisilvae TaxID=1542435 RepID=UPI000D746EFD|nr:hypothetical protein [Nocardioides solisilvae]
MPVLRLRQALRLLSGGVPRLWRAAREAGADRRTATDVVVTSVLALLVSARVVGSGWREQNAVRHFAWQAHLAARHGEALAVAVGEAQERGSADPDDSRVDEANNRVGRAHGLAGGPALLRGGRWAALTRLAEAGRLEWQQRELSAQPLADGTDPRDAGRRAHPRAPRGPRRRGR